MPILPRPLFQPSGLRFGLVAGAIVLAGLALVNFYPLDAHELKAEPLKPASAESPQSGLPVTEVRIAAQTFKLEVASTPQQAETGLMYRTALPANQGMLFRFESPHPVAFWMKNTRIPLDMLFIQDGKIVTIAHQAQPCHHDPCPVYPSGLPVDMVIELPGGTAAKASIQTGTRIQLLPLAHTIKPALTRQPAKKNRN